MLHRCYKNSWTNPNHETVYGQIHMWARGQVDDSGWHAPWAPHLVPSISKSVSQQISKQLCSVLQLSSLRGLATPWTFFLHLLCQSDWLFHGESCPCLGVVHPGCAWSYKPVCTWHCSIRPPNSMSLNLCNIQWQLGERFRHVNNLH